MTRKVWKLSPVTKIKSTRKRLRNVWGYILQSGTRVCASVKGKHVPRRAKLSARPKLFSGIEREESNRGWLTGNNLAIKGCKGRPLVPSRQGAETANLQRGSLQARKLSFTSS